MYETLLILYTRLAYVAENESYVATIGKRQEELIN